MTHRLNTIAIRGTAVVAVLFLAGCRPAADRPAADRPAADRVAEQPPTAPPPSALDQFWDQLQQLCGQAFPGRVVEDTTDNPDFAGQPLVMHVRTCEPDRILVPFHAGENRSRTWVFTRTADGLRLKHDHRHEDGTEEELTQYGGDTLGPGEPNRQEFHADDHTAELLPEAATNVWTVEIDPGRTFAYALRREGTDRRFRAEFDLTSPVDPPPPPWGYDR